MHQQVRIAADRRGEVRVGLVGEAEVADVVRAVDRLPQRAQHHGLQQLRIGPALDRREQLGVVLGVRLVAAAQVQAELLEELAQALPASPASALRARGTAPAARGSAGSPTRTRWPPACIPRSGGARRCAAPARCARSCPGRRRSSASRWFRNRSRRACARALSSSWNSSLQMLQMRHQRLALARRLALGLGRASPPPRCR